MPPPPRLYSLGHGSHRSPEASDGESPHVEAAVATPEEHWRIAGQPAAKEIGSAIAGAHYELLAEELIDLRRSNPGGITGRESPTPDHDLPSSDSPPAESSQGETLESGLRTRN